jgi:hypothetical protein
MTVYNGIIDAWELGGEPSDLDPFAYDANGDIALDGSGNYIFDQTSKGYKYFIDQFNRAQVALGNWRRRNGRFVKFKKFIRKFQVTLGTTDELDGIMDFENNLFTFNSAVTNSDKFMEDMFLELNLEDAQEFVDIQPSNYDIGDLWIQGDLFYRSNAQNAVFNGLDWYLVSEQILSTTYLRIQEFIDNGDGTFTLYFDDKALEDLTEYKKLKVKGRLFSFVIQGDISKKTLPYFIEMDNWPYAILNISNEGDRLKRTEYRGSLYEPGTNSVEPSEFIMLNNKVYFDELFLDKYTIEFEVYSLPDSLVDFNSEFSIPRAYHECLLTWVEWRLAKRQQEFQKAFSIKRDLIDEIEWTMNEEEMEFMQDNLGNFQVDKDV